MRSRLLFIAPATLALLAALYAVAGFWYVPRLVLREAPGVLADRGHALKLGGFSFNPFTLEARATGVALEDAAGKAVFSAAEVFADLEWRSIASRGAVLSQVRITRPALDVDIDKAGRVNLAALNKDDGKPSQGLPRFSIGTLDIAEGAIAFADQREGYRNRFEQLTLKLNALSTFGTESNSRHSGYTLSAQTADGAKLQWQGDLSLQPLALSGKLHIADIDLPALAPYLDTWLAAPLASGRGELDLPHRLLVKDGRPQLLLDNASVSVSDLALGGATSQAAPLKLAQFSAGGVSVDTLAQSVAVQSLDAKGLRVALKREADGSLDIARLFRSARPAAAGKPVSPASAKVPWTVKADKFELADGAVEISDVPSGISLALEGLAGKTGAIDSAMDKPLAFQLAGTARGGGKLAWNGRLLPQGGGVASRIEITALPVALLQPLVPADFRLRLASGEATLAGDLQIGGRQSKFSYSGSAALNNVSVNEPAGAKPGALEGTQLLAWKSLSAPKLDLSLSPNRLDMDELRLVAPVGRLAIAPDSSLNVKRALSSRDAKPANGSSDGAIGAPVATGAAAQADNAGAGFPLSIRRLRVSDGSLDFSDESLAQNVRIAIEELGGTFNGLSSDRNTRSQFNLEGKVGEFGFAQLSGTLNAFAWRDATSFRVDFRNLDLAKISPYAIKFAGYRIASGKLSLDLRYRINNGVIQGDNNAVFDQLQLGEKIDSPGAMDLPLELAVSLLKDENGRIDLAIPVSGSLDDPQFDYGAVIRRAIGNVISRIVTAPFRALASLFGGGSSGEEVGAIAFEPGGTRLLPPEREKIQRVAQGLAKRPELKVTVPGRADSAADGVRLKRAALAREVAKRAGFDVAEDESAGGLSIGDSRTRNAIRELFAERFTQAELDRLRTEAEAKAREANASQPAVLERLRNLAAGEPQVTDARPFYFSLMRRLGDSQPLPQGALEQLAQARAQAIAQALRQAGVAEDRISLLTIAPTSDAQAKAVKVELSLGKK